MGKRAHQCINNLFTAWRIQIGKWNFPTPPWKKRQRYISLYLGMRPNHTLNFRFHVLSRLLCLQLLFVIIPLLTFQQLNRWAQTRCAVTGKTRASDLHFHLRSNKSHLLWTSGIQYLSNIGPYSGGAGEAWSEMHIWTDVFKLHLSVSAGVRGRPVGGRAGIGNVARTERWGEMDQERRRKTSRGFGEIGAGAGKVDFENKVYIDLSAVGRGDIYNTHSVTPGPKFSLSLSFAHPHSLFNFFLLSLVSWLYSRS